MHTTVFSSTLLDLFQLISKDTKSVLSVLVAAAGASATLVSGLNSLTEGRTRRAKIKAKTDRVKELVDLLNELKETEEFFTCKTRLLVELDRTLCEVDVLRKRDLRAQGGAKDGLTLMQRTFLLFRPQGAAWIIHLFAYAFMCGGPLAMLLLLLFGKSGDAIFGDVTILVVFGALAFRGWAVAENTWASVSNASVPFKATNCEAAAGKVRPEQLSDPKAGEGAWSQPQDNVAQVLFIMQRHLSTGMLVAQISLWTAVFCVLESLEDVIFAGVDARASKVQWSSEATGSLLLFFISLLGAALCRWWADSERRNATQLSGKKDAGADPWPFFERSSALTSVSFYLASALALKWKWAAIALLWSDPWDITEVTFLIVIAGIALFRLTYLHREDPKSPCKQEASRETNAKPVAG